MRTANTSVALSNQGKNDRVVFPVAQAGEAILDERDEFTAERCAECKAIDGGHNVNCSQHPDAANNGHPALKAKKKKSITVRTCRVCGCTDQDCRQCIQKTGSPCYWVGADLCSACQPATEPGPVTNGHIDLREIPLDQITPWQAGQMRTHFDEVKLAELAASIKEKGVLQPILIRPMPRFRAVLLTSGRYAVTNQFGFELSNHDTEWEAEKASNDRTSKQNQRCLYELVAGERRWRASKIAGVATIPAILRELDDKTALEIQVIENLQRTDLSALEEAAGYKRLIAEHGYTADSLAERLGKSKSYVYGRLKLCGLPPVVSKHLASGEISPSIAELIGRVPSEELREKLCAVLFRHADAEWGHPPTFRATKDLIEREYMKELKGAPFSKSDAKLIPSAGACTKCAKLTGNDRGSYPDGRADVCTDPICFKAKVAAQQKREVQKLANNGARVLDDKESKELFQYGWLSQKATAQYVDLEEECYEAFNNNEDQDDEPQAPTYGEVLGDSVKIEAVGTDNKGKAHRLVLRETAAAALKEKGIELPPVYLPRDSEDWKKRQAEDQKRAKIRQAVVVEAGEFVAKAIVSKYEEVQGTANGSEDIANLIQTLIGCCCARFARSYASDIGAIAKRRGVAIEGKQGPIQNAEAMAKGLDAGSSLGLLAEILATLDLEWWSRLGTGKIESSVCSFAGVDVKEIEKRISKEQREKSKPKAKAKGAGK